MGLMGPMGPMSPISRIGTIRPIPHYSTDILKAAPVAQGANTNETINVAPSKRSHACGLVPVTLACTAPLPKMSTGI